MWQKENLNFIKSMLENDVAPIEHDFFLCKKHYLNKKFDHIFLVNGPAPYLVRVSKRELFTLIQP